MSSSSRTLLRSLRSLPSRHTRPILSRSIASSSTRNAEASTSQPSASSSSSTAPLNPKISPLVDSISSLTLLEVSELVTALKTRLNITEIALPASSAPAAASQSAGAASADAAPAEEKPKEKTIFTVKLEKIDATNKAKVIREVKALMPNMNLVEAKKFVESCPQTLKENLPKDEAEKLQKTMEALGATVSLS